MRAIKGLLWLALLSVPVLAGCADNGTSEGDTQEPVQRVLTDVRERAQLPFNTSLGWSQTLEAGPFGILEPVSVLVDVPLPETEGGAAIDPTEPPKAHLGLFMPDLPGCDFSDLDAGAYVAYDPDTGAPELQAERGLKDCKVPVIVDAGPYYGESDVEADERGSGRLGEFLVTNFVPHGYAVAQVSVLGSGKSTHCFDMFGLAEQLGVHHAVEWLGTQEWSNGNVGLIGRSYDGSTPWMAAAHGSEHLKTIVPISGLSGLGDLVQWNGASESRILTFHNVIYGTFGVNAGVDPSGPSVDPGERFHKEVLQRATCPDWVTATPWGAASYVTGDEVVSEHPAYWHERNFVPRVLENYDGSLYMIHGLQDGNVDPHAGWLAQLALQENGNDVKSLWGQWYHSYPDRPGEHGGEDDEPRNSVRYDWAQDLLEWFDHYLMETGPKPPLHHEMQQLDGRWRVEAEFPPADADIVEVPLGSGMVQVSPTDDATAIDLGALDAGNETVIGGLSSITLTVTPTGPGGQVFVELRDGTDGHDFGLSYGIMDLRHATGTFAPVVPGMPMEITIPFQLFDAALEAGNHLELVIGASGGGFLPSVVSTPVTIDLSASALHLSTLERGAGHAFAPPAWTDEDGTVVG